MLNIASLNYHASGKPLFRNASLQVFAGQRVGLVGKNGCGKSTLFRLIRGEIPPDGGEISLQAGKTLAFVEQEIANADRPALEFVLDGDTELRALEKALGKKHHDAAWFEAQHRFEAIDGYAAPARAAQLLDGLGFAPREIGRPVASFSGGWRMRLNLARALMKRADLLLLDEPTNHLDLEAILWLEQHLARYPGSVLLVSHDREFLNATATRIAHLHDGVIDDYAGNYDDFERARAERLTQQAAAYRQQQEKIARLEDFVRRFRAKATKARQAQSRLKALERLTRIAPVHAEAGHFGLTVEAPECSPDLLIRAEKIAFGYGDKPLFAGVDFILRKGSRIALLGPNGAGKSTFVKLLAGKLAPTAGRLETAPEIRVGYFAQHQLEQLDGAATPLEHLERLAPEKTTLELRSFLGRFGLGGNEEQRPVCTFSGGEKSRLALALLAWKKPHLLLLDEPTNHLDLDMRDALTLALEEYGGAMVLVSHDRALIRATADELWLVADGAVAPFNGDLEDYRKWIEARRAEAAPRPPAERPRPESAPRPRKKALLARQARLESELAQTQARLAEVNRLLADPATYAAPDAERIRALNREREALETKAAQLEEGWLELEMALEEAG
jgi:ATP-binding cassette subfamily F protein 3